MQNLRTSLLVVSMFLLGALSAQAGLICGETRYTSVYQGTGDTCSDAQSSVYSQAWRDIYINCYYWNYQFGHCDAEFVATEECSSHPGCSTVSGYYAYSCLECDPEDPCY